MTTETYSSPVDKLLSYGDPREKDNLGVWPDYVAEFGFGAEHIPDLIRLATNQELSEADSEGDEVWGPLHAWRTLGQLKAEAAIEPLLELLDVEDDWASTEVPEVYGMIGPVALPTLANFFQDPDQEMLARSEAAGSLEKIAEMHPDSRALVVAILSNALDASTENDLDLNGYIVAYLIELKAVEAAPIIEKAYANDLVDISMAGDWHSVQVNLGLAKANSPRLPQSNSSPPTGRGRNVRRRSGGIVPPTNPADKAKAKAKRKMAKASRKKNRKS